MNCKTAEQRFPEALSGELSGQELTVFNEHLSGCARCRSDFESLRRTVGLMQRLSGPHPASRTHADDTAISRTLSHPERVPAKPHPAHRSWSRTSRPFRIAAGLAIAFLTGYGTRYVQAPRTPDARVVQSLPGFPVTPDSPGHIASDSVRRAFLDARVRHAGGSDLARCLIALAGQRG